MHMITDSVYSGVWGSLVIPSLFLSNAVQHLLLCSLIITDLYANFESDL